MIWLCVFLWIWLELCTSCSPTKVVTTTSITLNSNNIHNGDILENDHSTNVTVIVVVLVVVVVKTASAVPWTADAKINPHLPNMQCVVVDVVDTAVITWLATEWKRKIVSTRGWKMQKLWVPGCSCTWFSFSDLLSVLMSLCECWHCQRDVRPAPPLSWHCQRDVRPASPL